MPVRGQDPGDAVAGAVAEGSGEDGDRAMIVAPALGEARGRGTNAAAAAAGGEDAEQIDARTMLSLMATKIGRAHV